MNSKLFLLLPLLLTLLKCVNSVSGGGSEAGNGIMVGYVLDSELNPVSGVSVQAFPVGYNPLSDGSLSDSLSSISDEHGRFVLYADTGLYNIISLRSEDGTNAFSRSIRIVPLESDTTHITPLQLNTPGSIYIPVPGSLAGQTVHVYIRGTPYSARIEPGAEGVWISSLPSGDLPAILYSAESSSGIISDSTTLLPGDTAIAASVLFLTRLLPDGTVHSSDLLVKERFSQLGYRVDIVSDRTFTPDLTSGRALLVISASADADTMANKLRDVSIPVLDMEIYLLDNLGMTDTIRDTHFGYDQEISSVQITSPDHPAASPYSGEVALLTSAGQIEWGIPSSEATIIAHLPGDTNKAVIFSYEKGAAMVGTNAPARRITFLLLNADVAKLTEEGWVLLENCAQWAIGAR